MKSIQISPLGFLASLATLAVAFTLVWAAPAQAQTAQATGLGARDGRLQPPSLAPNSVSSQARLYPEHPRRDAAHIEPLRFKGSGEQAMQQLADLIRRTPGSTLVKQTPGYLHAEMRTRWLKFTDDLELLLDEPAGVVHVRSASRLGYSDLNANRKRVEDLRSRFDAAQNAGVAAVPNSGASASPGK